MSIRQKYYLIKRSYQSSIFYAILFISFSFFCFVPYSIPCSTFLLKKGIVLLAGHNLDSGSHKPGKIFVNKRDLRKTGCSWYELTSGEKASSPPLTWTSKYGSVTYNTMGREFPDGGMNEASLYIGEMTLRETRFPEDLSKPRIFMVLWMQYVLDNFYSVDQVIECTSRIMIDGWRWHSFTADREGNAAVIEFLDGKLVVFTGEDLPVPVLCNTKYAQEIERLSAYEGSAEVHPFP